MAIRGTVWTPVGPSPMTQGGRQDNGLVSAIAVNPNNPNIIYIGTAGGGVWRTMDGGTNWKPIFDRQISMGVGNPAALAIDPSNTNTIYIGTSFRLNRLGGGQRRGLFKSTDGGASMVRLGSGYPADNIGNANRFFSRNINVITVDPANSNTLYMGTDRGVHTSTDGGLNWRRGAGIANNGDVRSLVLDTTSPIGNRILYAGVTNGGGVNGGVFQSTDGGQNWNVILNGATPAVAGALGGGNIGKTVVDLAPPTAPPAPGGIQVIYASMEGTGGAPDPVGVFVSIDQGANWVAQGFAGFPGTNAGTQNGYSFHMAIDPASPGDGANDTIYMGAVNHARSTNSGGNFTQLNGLHADNHSWAFAPQPGGGSSTVFCGNDGGIFRSTNGTTWTALNTGGLQTGLFYNMAVRPDATASVTLGAMQDNGAQTTSGAAGLGWNSPQGGDGWDVAYDGVTAGQSYATSGFWGPNPPCTRIYLSNADLTDLAGNGPPGRNITPWGAATDQGCYLAHIATDPNNGGVVYVAGNQNLWQSRNSGGNWNNISPFASGFITARVSVAPSNGNNVVVANGNQVSVSTNALGPPASITFTNITRNLPGRNVLRAAFDPNDPTVVYAVLGGFSGSVSGPSGHVFRTTIGGTTWTDISPELDIPFGALALDGSDTPTTIYVGTDLGVLRSVDQGLTWSVLDDIHFPGAPVTDLEIGRGSGILRAATYGRGVFEFAPPDGPVITMNLEDHFDFGTVCDGPAHLTLQIFNVGKEDLLINSVQRIMGSTAFEVDPFPTTPLVVAAGEEVNFSVHFTPMTPGVTEMATIRITSNDPGAPEVDVLATGIGGTATAELAIADSGHFGNVCLGEFVDRDLVINNSGDCPLVINAINSSSAAFVRPDVISFPLVVESGNSLNLPIRFQPVALGIASATISVSSNDPNSPAEMEVEGFTPAPHLVLSIADSGDFGDVCVGDYKDLPLTVANSGDCPLAISSVTSSSAEFLVPDVAMFPLMVAPGTSAALYLRFQPTSFEDKSATITVVSDDPASPATLDVSGHAPSGRMVVMGTTDFGAVELGHRALLSISICNTGDCDLQVTKVAFKDPTPCEEYGHRRGGCPPDCACHSRRHRDARGGDLAEGRCDQKCLNFKIVSNPFPERLHPGSCMQVQIAFVPSCDTAACCELVIESDDPENQSRTLFVTGHIRRTLSSALKCWAGQQLRDMLHAS